MICKGLPPFSDPSCALHLLSSLCWKPIHLHFCSMHAKHHPSLEMADFFFFLLIVFSFTFSYGRCPFWSPFLFTVPHASIYLTQTNPVKSRKYTHSHTHAQFLSVSCLHLPPFPFSVSVVAGHLSLPPAWFRYLLDVVVNTVGAVTVIYGHKPSAAAWHNCQLPWETTWFILSSDAYGFDKSDFNGLFVHHCAKLKVLYCINISIF